MKLLVKAAVLAATLGASAAASAETFDFSYIFADGQQLTGSLDGTLSGTAITNISNLQVSLDGTAFSGGTNGTPGNPGNPTSLQIYGYNSATGLFDDSVAPVFSTVASQNQFEIADINPSVDQSGANYYFAFTNDPVNGALAAAINWLHTDSNGNPQIAADPSALGNYGTWSVQPVPLPAALPLLVSGLGLFGFARRRAVK